MHKSSATLYHGRCKQSKKWTLLPRKAALPKMNKLSLPPIGRALPAAVCLARLTRRFLTTPLGMWQPGARPQAYSSPACLPQFPSLSPPSSATPRRPTTSTTHRGSPSVPKLMGRSPLASPIVALPIWAYSTPFREIIIPGEITKNVPATTDLQQRRVSPHTIDKKLATKKVNVDGVEQETEETVETTYKIRPIDQVFKADFANYHFAVAKETLAEMRDLYSDEEYEEERRQLREDKKAGLLKTDPDSSGARSHEHRTWPGNTPLPGTSLASRR